MNLYLQDILFQAQALRDFKTGFSLNGLPELKQRIENNEFDRIIISGMGSSYYASYPAYLELSRLQIPVLWVNAAELVQYLPGLIGPKSLLWLNSQSGRSAELLHVLERVKDAPAGFVLSSVNDAGSPMALEAGLSLKIHAGEEKTVSIKTYSNMLVNNFFAARFLAGETDLETLWQGLEKTIKAINLFLKEYETNLEKLKEKTSGIETLYLLGRGPSMAAVWTGSLINKEAAKSSFEGLNCADFRHGPMEMVRPGFGAFIFSGPRKTRALNHHLALEIKNHGGRVIWADSRPDPELETFLLPEVPEAFLGLAEILPMQLLTIIKAAEKNVEPGTFQIVGKVTEVE